MKANTSAKLSDDDAVVDILANMVHVLITHTHTHRHGCVPYTYIKDFKVEKFQ